MTYKKRKLSQFMGQEMIYDYLSNEIDPVRKKAFEDFIQEDEEFREEVDGVKNSLNYLEALSKTELADHLLSNIELKKSWSQAVSEKLQWGKRSNPLKWAVEAGVVSLIVAAIVIFIPWDKIILKIDSNNFILHEETLDNQQAEEKTKIDQNYRLT